MQITTIGLDIAKNVFQVYGIDATEKVVVRKRIAPIREHPSEPVGQAEAPISHRQQHYAAVRREPPTIECSCDFLGVNGWKPERQDRIVGHGGRGACVDVAGLASNPTPHQCITPCSPAIQTPSGE